MSDTPVEKLRALYDRFGHEQYGEDVTQLQHAQQCATLARAAMDSVPFVLAAFFHDVGHLLRYDGMAPMGRYGMRGHEIWGADFLSQLGFGEDVTVPVREHVDAKRFLCAIDPNYYAKLSQASKETLRFQGGPFNGRECEKFESNSRLQQILNLRLIDDEGKDDSLELCSVDWIFELAAQYLEKANQQDWQ